MKKQKTSFSKSIQHLKNRLTQNLLPQNRWMAKITFVILGILSTAWFLIRVIPKPSRAYYPCMRTAAPLASGFVIYLLSLASGTLFLKRTWQALLQRKISLFFVMMLIMVLSFSTALLHNTSRTKATALKTMDEAGFEANSPVGTPAGIHPGRVVWVWNPDATNESMSNSDGDYWFMDRNVSQEEIDTMLVDGLRNLAGTRDLETAWDEVFRYFNRKKGKGDSTYQPGEKIFIKLNLTNSSNGMDGTKRVNNLERMDQTPQLVLSMLKQLVEVVGVPQDDIYCGDTYRTFRDFYWDKCHSAFPDVHYIDGLGINGREQSTPSAEDKLFFSDSIYASRLPEEYLQADYFINLSCLKSHNSAGITMAAKNHQGTYISAGDTPDQQSAGDMHYCFPNQSGWEGYGKYRQLVDYMGHEKLGENTLLFLVDGLWAGRGWQGYMEKWNMEPFMGDYPSSLFLSQDAVAIECVGRDFLQEEYKNKKDNQKFPYYDGVDDYLLQAADSSFWPEGIIYDPERDSVPISSLGVFEYWNNAADKLYTRNLMEGEGIELVRIFQQPDEPVDYANAADYESYQAETAPVIDGMGNESCWEQNKWARIQYDWFEESGKNPPSYDDFDFSGKYKVSWTSDYLYLLVEIRDDTLNDDIVDPLEKYWEEDCIEIFIDEDHSGGQHRADYNAWAYHTSPVTGDVVDINKNGDYQLFNDHIDFEVVKNGNVYSIEYRIKIYNDTYSADTPDSARVQLEVGKTMGFSLAYCEDDGNGRENFIGSVSGGLDSWRDADLFGQLKLTMDDNTAPVISSVHQNQTIYVGENCASVLPDYTGEVYATDNSGGELDISQDPKAGTELSGASREVTLTVTDFAGNAAETSFEVELQDTSKPVITCIDNQEFDLAQDESKYTVSGTELDPVTSRDNCTVALIYSELNYSASLDGASFSPGTTTVTWHIKDEAGNTASCSFDVTVNEAVVSITSLKEKGISIYPNPVSGKLFIRSPGIKINRAMVYDLNGKKWMEKEGMGPQGSLNVSQLTNQVYLLKIHTEKGSFTTQILKQ